MNREDDASLCFTPDRSGWERLFASIDRRDAGEFVRYFTPMGEFRFGNAPAVVGCERIRDAVAGFFAMIAACRHRLIDCWIGPEQAVGEGEVTYTTPAGAVITVPFVNVFTLAGTQIASYRIYIDNSPLFAALAG